MTSTILQESRFTLKRLKKKSFFIVSTIVEEVENHFTTKECLKIEIVHVGHVCVTIFGFYVEMAFFLLLGVADLCRNESPHLGFLSLYCKPLPTRSAKRAYV